MHQKNLKVFPIIFLAERKKKKKAFPDWLQLQICTNKDSRCVQDIIPGVLILWLENQSVQLVTTAD